MVSRSDLAAKTAAMRAQRVAIITPDAASEAKTRGGPFGSGHAEAGSGRAWVSLSLPAKGWVPAWLVTHEEQDQD